MYFAPKRTLIATFRLHDTQLRYDSPKPRHLHAWFEVDIVDPTFHHCICGKVYQQDLSSGYRNLLKHLAAKHKGYEALTNANGTLQPNITNFLESGPSDLDKWADWIVMKMLPISLCEDPITQSYMRLSKTFRRTLKAHIFCIMRRVEKVIRQNLPQSFGLVFDGWTTAGIHYVVLFAVFRPTDYLKTGRVLLAFSPYEDESGLGAQCLCDFIADTLEEFERPWSAVLLIEKLTMKEVRALFDHTMASYPVTKKYLSPHALIVNNATFESALVKLQSGKKLTPAEEVASERLLLTHEQRDTQPTDKLPLSFAQQV